MIPSGTLKRYRTPGGSVYPLYLDLATRPHLLIAGATGSGKSVALNGIIISLLTVHSPNKVQFILIDPKIVELYQYKDLPHIMGYSSDPTGMMRVLYSAIEETERRYQYMREKQIKEYDGSDLYVVIDELADLMTTQKKRTMEFVTRLAQIGRGAHVHVIACSQNVQAEIIPTILKVNFTTILGLRTATKAQSRYLIDAPGCELLPDPKKEGAGYGYVRDGADLTKEMLYMYSEQQIKDVISWWTSPKCIIG